MARSIFEQVDETGAAGRRKVGPPAGAGREAETRGRRATRLWLLLLALMVVVQIVVGGLTRLTDSGLSITEWRPVTGVLPPLSEAEWQAELQKYRATTEYQEQNAGMSLEAFQVIYWWEWGHRLWGRLIGLVFVGGLAILALRRAIPPGWTGRILFVGALGALQGVIGWWMVASGLTGRLDVSQHRLAVHLGLAFLIVALLLWYGASLKGEAWQALQARRRREAGAISLGALFGALLAAQIVMGAYVAGLDGGMVYSQWPMMGDGIYPSAEPFQPFENPAAAQFVHRMLGYAVALAALGLAWRMRGSAFAKTRRWGVILLGVVAAQVVLGVLTVTQAAALPLAAAHQLGAVLLVGAWIHAQHQLAYPAEERLAAA